jgi:acyl phosphate:glycerol-3-phosphate acyltransferase
MTPEQLLLYLAFPLAAYLLGAIPFAFVIGKAHGVDIRTVGSKNIGATNLGRTLGKKYFWQAFLLDALKGFLPTLLASLYVNHLRSAAIFGAAEPFPSWTPLITAIAAVLGHLFPIWLKFKGGKGVSTGFGCVLGFWPLYTLAGLVGGLVFVAVLLVYRYISLASITGAFAFTLAVILFGQRDPLPFLHTSLSQSNLTPLIIIASLFTAMILIRHRANISRLLKGTEPKIGQKQIDKSNFQK